MMDGRMGQMDGFVMPSNTQLHYVNYSCMLSLAIKLEKSSALLVVH